MVGNVWELVSDCWHDNFNGAPTDGSSWGDNCDKHPIRGGAWVENPWDTRFGSRWSTDAGNHDTSTGFRLARDF
jgi:formylglycine-generating enzyme required for sulfatase activity